MRSRKAKAQRHVIYMLLPIVAILIWAWPLVLLFGVVLAIGAVILLPLAAVLVPVLIVNSQKKDGARQLQARQQMQMQIQKQKEWEAYHRAYSEWYYQVYLPSQAANQVNQKSLDQAEQ